MEQKNETYWKYMICLFLLECMTELWNRKIYRLFQIYT